MNACQDSTIDFHDVAHEPAAVALCRTCHAVEAGKNGIGPTLAGIVGSKAGDVARVSKTPPLKFEKATPDVSNHWPCTASVGREACTGPLS